MTGENNNMKAIQLEEEVHNFCLNNVKNKENLKEEGKGRRTLFIEK